jgi:rubredoxin
MNARLAVVPLFLGLLAVAAWLSAAPDSSYANSDESRTQWMCEPCGHVFSLTAREAADAARENGGVLTPLTCPKCRQAKAYRSLKCRTCDTIYLGENAPGHSGRCPACKPSSEFPTGRHPDGAWNRLLQTQENVEDSRPPIQVI